jgi:hypothetical protein
VAFQGADQVQLHPSSDVQGETFTTLALQTKTMEMSCVFTENANMEHAVFLDKMGCWSMHSELL